MYKSFLKRVFDLFVSLLAFPFFCLLWFVVAIAIKLDDGGPIFYKAERIGRNSKKIYMYKFRSMKVNCENILNPDGSTYNAKDDPRVTKVGRFLRESSIDEIPQILNVIKGDMSLIGPRASGWGALSNYQADEVDKMKVRPGISGYTQAYYRNGLSVREKRLYDAWYANNVSFGLDVKIFFKTIATVLKRENVYTNEASDQGSDKNETSVVVEELNKEKSEEKTSVK
ncbi:MAG: sugar transferase [Ruminococcaceae bacterium]|nr:sugar transferase [Oscillospiraceae bacterium]